MGPQQGNREAAGDRVALGSRHGGKERKSATAEKDKGSVALERMAAYRHWAENNPTPRNKSKFKGLSHERVGGVWKGKGMVIQSKLEVGGDSDKYERDADRYTAAVIGRLQASSGPATTTFKRIGKRPTAHTQIGTKKLHLSDATGGPVPAGIEVELRRAKEGGNAMPPAIRAALEQAMGADFSEVRLHADARADKLNRRLQARAFTSGTDLFFRIGEYQPETKAGQQLLIHELRHVMQQTGQAYTSYKEEAASSDSGNTALSHHPSGPPSSPIASDRRQMLHRTISYCRNGVPTHQGVTNNDDFKEYLREKYKNAEANAAVETVVEALATYPKDIPVDCAESIFKAYIKLRPVDGVTLGTKTRKGAAFESLSEIRDWGFKRACHLIVTSEEDESLRFTAKASKAEHVEDKWIAEYRQPKNEESRKVWQTLNFTIELTPCDEEDISAGRYPDKKTKSCHRELKKWLATDFEGKKFRIYYRGLHKAQELQQKTMRALRDLRENDKRVSYHGDDIHKRALEYIETEQGTREFASMSTEVRQKWDKKYWPSIVKTARKLRKDRQAGYCESASDDEVMPDQEDQSRGAKDSALRYMTIEAIMAHTPARGAGGERRPNAVTCEARTRLHSHLGLAYELELRQHVQGEAIQTSGRNKVVVEISEAGCAVRIFGTEGRIVCDRSASSYKLSESLARAIDDELKRGEPREREMSDILQRLKEELVVPEGEPVGPSGEHQWTKRRPVMCWAGYGLYERYGRRPDPFRKVVRHGVRKRKTKRKVRMPVRQWAGGGL